jgi:hypothetical protein
LATVAEGQSGPELPRLFAPPAVWARLPALVRACAVLAVLAVAAGVAYVGAVSYPDTAPPRGSELERRVAAVFGRPAGKTDDRIVGDLLVERFYAVDAPTGERYVGDLIKGRIQGIEALPRGSLPDSYMLVLDLATVNRSRSLYSAYVNAVAPPDDASVYYLGARVPAGLIDAFRLNYDGGLPEKRSPFRSEETADIYAYLVEQPFDAVTVSGGLLPVDGFNYLLSNTQRFEGFRIEFGLSRAVFLSELMIVDATGREGQKQLFRLLEQYPASPR